MMNEDNKIVDTSTDTQDALSRTTEITDFILSAEQRLTGNQQEGNEPQAERSLEELNQADLAEILPDVTTSTGGGGVCEFSLSALPNVSTRRLLAVYEDDSTTTEQLTAFEVGGYPAVERLASGEREDCCPTFNHLAASEAEACPSTQQFAAIVTDCSPAGPLISCDGYPDRGVYVEKLCPRQPATNGSKFIPAVTLSSECNVEICRTVQQLVTYAQNYTTVEPLATSVVRECPAAKPQAQCEIKESSRTAQLTIYDVNGGSALKDLVSYDNFCPAAQSTISCDVEEDTSAGHNQPVELSVSQSVDRLILCEVTKDINASEVNVNSERKQLISCDKSVDSAAVLPTSHHIVQVSSGESHIAVSETVVSSSSSHSFSLKAKPESVAKQFDTVRDELCKKSNQVIDFQQEGISSVNQLANNDVEVIPTSKQSAASEMDKNSSEKISREKNHLESNNEIMAASMQLIEQGLASRPVEKPLVIRDIEIRKQKVQIGNNTEIMPADSCSGDKDVRQPERQPSAFNRDEFSQPEINSAECSEPVVSSLSMKSEYDLPLSELFIKKKSRKKKHRRHKSHADDDLTCKEEPLNDTVMKSLEVITDTLKKMELSSGELEFVSRSYVPLYKTTLSERCSCSCVAKDVTNNNIIRSTAECGIQFDADDFFFYMQYPQRSDFSVQVDLKGANENTSNRINISQSKNRNSNNNKLVVESKANHVSPIKKCLITEKSNKTLLVTNEPAYSPEMSDGCSVGSIDADFTPLISANSEVNLMDRALDQDMLNSLCSSTTSLIRGDKRERINPDFDVLPEASFSMKRRKRVLMSDSDDTVEFGKRRRTQKDEIGGSGDLTNDYNGEEGERGVRVGGGKRFQKCGLYSNSYKGVRSSPCKNKEQDVGLLPAPIHYGKYLREQEEDFLLPFDIYDLRQTGKLKKQKPLTPKFKRIRNNVCVDARALCRGYDPHPCSCVPPVNQTLTGEESMESGRGCGEACLNRLVYTECNAGTCPCGSLCSNQRIQRHEWMEGLEKIRTPDRGYGVYTTKQINPGELIIEYCGEVVSEKEFRRRMTEDYSKERHHYCVSLDSGSVIDGYRMGNTSRFINHSCDPNCEMQKWNVNGSYRLVLFSLRQINAGEELTYDYNFHSYNLNSQQVCHCGSKNCRGVIGGRRQKLGQVTGSHEVIAGNEVNRAAGLTNGGSDKPQSLSRVTSRTEMIDVVEPHPHPHPVTRLVIPTPRLPTKREQKFCKESRLLLIRNVHKIHRIRWVERRKRKKKLLINNASITPLTSPKTTTKVSSPAKTPNQNSTKTCTRNSNRKSLVSPNDDSVSQLRSGKRILSLSPVKSPKKVSTTPLSNKNIDKRVNGAGTVTNRSNNSESPKSLPRVLVSAMEIVDHDDSFQEISNTSKILGSARQIDDLNTSDLDHRISSSKDLGSLQGYSRRTTPRRTGVVSALENGSDLLNARLNDETIPSSSDLVEVESIEASQSSVGLDRSIYIKRTPVKKSPGNRSRVVVEGSDKKRVVDIVNCICNIYGEDGLMVQCEMCKRWQHCMCMRVEGNEEDYACESCRPRNRSKEVVLEPQPDDGLAHCVYYLTLMRGEELQVRVGDCVYVAREGYDTTRLTINDRVVLDIFRVERLWKKYNGEKCAFGYYYMRPNETFHEPFRRFFPCEVFRAPLYHVIPIEAVIGRCCVVDRNTYCKGRPKGILQEDMYICDFRVDRTARLFTKVTNRSKYFINTQPYCFDLFTEKLRPLRTLAEISTTSLPSPNFRGSASNSSEGIFPEESSEPDSNPASVPIPSPRSRHQQRRLSNQLRDSWPSVQSSSNTDSSNKHGGNIDIRISQSEEGNLGYNVSHGDLHTSKSEEGSVGMHHSILHASQSEQGNLNRMKNMAQGDLHSIQSARRDLNYLQNFSSELGQGKGQSRLSDENDNHKGTLTPGKGGVSLRYRSTNESNQTKFNSESSSSSVCSLLASSGHTEDSINKELHQMSGDELQRDRSASLVISRSNTISMENERLSGPDGREKVESVSLGSSGESFKSISGSNKNIATRYVHGQISSSTTLSDMAGSNSAPPQSSSLVSDGTQQSNFAFTQSNERVALAGVEASKSKPVKPPKPSPAALLSKKRFTLPSARLPSLEADAESNSGTLKAVSMEDTDDAFVGKEDKSSKQFFSSLLKFGRRRNAKSSSSLLVGAESSPLSVSPSNDTVSVDEPKVSLKPAVKVKPSKKSGAVQTDKSVNKLRKMLMKKMGKGSSKSFEEGSGKGQDDSSADTESDASGPELRSQALSTGRSLEGTPHLKENRRHSSHVKPSSMEEEDDEAEVEEEFMKSLECSSTYEAGLSSVGTDMDDYDKRYNKIQSYSVGLESRFETLHNVPANKGSPTLTKASIPSQDGNGTERYGTGLFRSRSRSDASGIVRPVRKQKSSADYAMCGPDKDEIEDQTSGNVQGKVMDQEFQVDGDKNKTGTMKSADVESTGKVGPVKEKNIFKGLLNRGKLSVKNKGNKEGKSHGKPGKVDKSKSDEKDAVEGPGAVQYPGATLHPGERDPRGPSPIRSATSPILTRVNSIDIEDEEESLDKFDYTSQLRRLDDHNGRNLKKENMKFLQILNPTKAGGKLKGSLALSLPDLSGVGFAVGNNLDIDEPSSRARRQGVVEKADVGMGERSRMGRTSIDIVSKEMTGYSFEITPSILISSVNQDKPKPRQRSGSASPGVSLTRKPSPFSGDLPILSISPPKLNDFKRRASVILPIGRKAPFVGDTVVGEDREARVRGLSPGRAAALLSPEEIKGKKMKRRATGVDPMTVATMFGRKSHSDVNKSAAKVLDSKKDTVTRLKHLRIVIETYQSERRGEAKRFFEQYYSHIYFLFHDGFTNVESCLGQRASKAHREELDFMLYILETILVLLPEMIQKRWQLHSFSCVLKKLLHPGNSVKLRREGMRLFLIWYQILMHNATDQCHRMFNSLVPCLTDPHSDVFTAVAPPLGKISPAEIVAILPPQASDRQPDNPDRWLLEALLVYMISEAPKIEWANKDLTRYGLTFLLDKFKEFYLPRIFPHYDPTLTIYRPFHDLPESLVCRVAARDVKTSVSLAVCQDTVIKWLTRYTTSPASSESSTDLRASGGAGGHQSLNRQDTLCMMVTPDSHMTNTGTGTEQVVPGSNASTLSTASSYTEKESNCSSGPGSGGEDGGRGWRETSRAEESKAVREVLFGCRENIDMIHEVFRQAFLFTHHRAVGGVVGGGEGAVVRRIIAVIRSWIQSNPLPEFMLEPDALATPTAVTGGGAESITTNRSLAQDLESSSSDVTMTSSGLVTPGAMLTSAVGIVPSAAGALPGLADKELRAGLQNILRIFITHSSYVFLNGSCTQITPPSPASSQSGGGGGAQHKDESKRMVQLEEQVDMCKRVLNFYRVLVMNVNMDKSTWEQLLSVLVWVTSTLMPVTPPSVKETTLSTRLAEPLFKTLIVTWIKANLQIVVSNHLWVRFLQVLSSLTDWVQLIREWAKTMDMLTKVLARYVYGLDLNDLPLDRLSEQKAKRMRGGVKPADGASNKPMLTGSQTNRSDKLKQSDDSKGASKQSMVRDAALKLLGSSQVLVPSTLASAALPTLIRPGESGGRLNPVRRQRSRSGGGEYSAFKPTRGGPVYQTIPPVGKTGTIGGNQTASQEGAGSQIMSGVSITSELIQSESDMKEGGRDQLLQQAGLLTANSSFPSSGMIRSSSDSSLLVAAAESSASIQEELSIDTSPSDGSSVVRVRNRSPRDGNTELRSPAYDNISSTSDVVATESEVSIGFRSVGGDSCSVASDHSSLIGYQSLIDNSAEDSVSTGGRTCADSFTCSDNRSDTEVLLQVTPDCSQSASSSRQHSRNPSSDERPHPYHRLHPPNPSTLTSSDVEYDNNDDDDEDESQSLVPPPSSKHPIGSDGGMEEELLGPEWEESGLDEAGLEDVGVGLILEEEDDSTVTSFEADVSQGEGSQRIGQLSDLGGVRVVDAVSKVEGSDLLRKNKNSVSSSVRHGLVGLEGLGVCAGGEVTGFTPEVAAVLWVRMLGCLGDVNKLKSAECHARVFEYLSDLLRLLIKLRDNQGVTRDNQTSPRPPVLVSPILSFISWLFEALELGEGYKEGKLLAYQMLCMALIRRQDTTLNSDLLLRFYTSIHHGLLNSNKEVSMVLVRSCRTKLFVESSLPGVSILMLDMIQAANTVLNLPADLKDCPRSEAVSLLGSLVCFPDHYSSVPVLKPNSAEHQIINIDAAQLKDIIVSTLLTCGRKEPAGLARYQALSSLLLFVYNELFTAGGSVKQSIDESAHSRGTGAQTIPVLHEKTMEAINILIDSLKSKDSRTIQIASHCLTILSYHSDLILNIIPQLYSTLIQALTSAILELVSSIESKKTKIKESCQAVVSMMFTLVEWAMKMPRPLLLSKCQSNPNNQSDEGTVLSLIFNTLHSVMIDRKEEELSQRLSSNSAGSRHSEILNYASRDDLFNDGSLTDRGGLSSDWSSGRQRRSLTDDRPQSRDEGVAKDSDVNKMRLAARTVVSHLLNSLTHFPLSTGAAQTNTSVVEGSDLGMESSDTLSTSNILFCVFNDLTLLSLVELPDNSAPSEVGGASSDQSGHGITTSQSNGPMRTSTSLTKDLSYLSNGSSNQSLDSLGNSVSQSVATLGSSSQSGYSLHSRSTNHRGSLSSSGGFSSKGITWCRGGRRCRVIVRDPSGKYCWDSNILYTGGNTSRITAEGIRLVPARKHTPKHNQVSPSRDGLVSQEPVYVELSQCQSLSSAPLLSSSPSNYSLQSSHVSSVNKSETTPSSSFQSFPLVLEDLHRGSGQEALDRLLVYIGATSKECLLEEAKPLNTQFSCPVPDQLTSAMESRVTQRISEELNMEESHVTVHRHDKDMSAQPMRRHEACDWSMPQDDSSFHLCRLFLSQFGFMTWEKRKQFDLLKKSDKLMRELRHLDTQRCRDTHKIAVIYVREGQEDKQSILSNDSGSPAYQQFIEALGWMVDLETHAGFMGGLQSTGSTGMRAPYYATSLLEIIFHVATLMPSLTADDQHRKMKHLGNDEVQIIWSEHTRDYRRGIISTEFGDVLIIIYPLQNTALYRIQILRKPEVPFFGPLLDGSVVPLEVLAPLVRETALNAGQAIRSTKPHYLSFYEERLRYVSGIIQQHKESTTFEDFCAQIYAPSTFINQHTGVENSSKDLPSANNESFVPLASGKTIKDESFHRKLSLGKGKKQSGSQGGKQQQQSQGSSAVTSARASPVIEKHKR